MSTIEREIDDHKNGKKNGTASESASDGAKEKKDDERALESEQTVKGKEREPEQNPPECLAQADVKTPWLDINARFQLRSNNSNVAKKTTRSEKSRKRLSFFSLPKFRPKNSTTESESTINGTNDDEQESKKTANDATGGAKEATNKAGMDDWHDLTVPKKRKIWQGAEGLALTIFGIALPAFVLVTSFMSMPHRLTLVLLNHPLETIAELLLLIAIPIANYTAWKAFCNNNFRYSIKRGISMGASITACLIVAGICVAGMFTGGEALRDDIGSDFGGGFIGLSLISLLTCAASAYIVNRFRLTRDFKKSRLQILTFTAIGALLSSLTVFGAEFRSWNVRLAEEKASSNVAKKRQSGLNELRALDPERELLLECSDPKATGLAGLFIPIKKSTLEELYFAVTGKPYSFKDIANSNFSSMPDDYLSRHVVGDKVQGLTMRRSYLSGNVHSRTLSSTLYWTFVFKNDSKVQLQDARAELGLPPGAVVSGFKVWKHGEPKDAKFLPSGKADHLERQSGNELGIVTDLGHNRALLQCQGVQQDEEVKAELSMIVPLKPDSDTTASISLPRFLATNFDLVGDHSLRIISDRHLFSTVKNIRTTTAPGNQFAIIGSLTPDQFEKSSLTFSAERPEKTLPVVVLDQIAIRMDRQDLKAQMIAKAKRTHKAQAQEQVVVMIDGSKGIQSQFDSLQKVMALKAASHKPGQAPQKKQVKTIPAKFVVENVIQTAAPAPKEFVIVVDGSSTMKDYVKPLTTALALLPKGIPAHVIVASQEHPELLEPMPIEKALPILEKMTFAGGQDNLESVVKAAELAGETSGGAVLWAHGPLPALNQEVYIVPQYTTAPKFYELPLGSGETDTLDFFKNHSEIGPFTSVPRNTTEVVDDLSAFLSKWKVDQNGFAVELTQTTKRPTKSVTATAAEATELTTLNANRQLTEYLNTHHISKATRLAVNYGFLSPVSCALVDDSTVENVDTVEEVEASATGEEPNSNESDTQPENTNDTTNGETNTTGSEAGANAESDANKQAEKLIQSKIGSSSAVEGDAPALQAATNGTIGPQGADATFITGVNTAGTVRVNNLANLEALMNIIANLVELGAGLIGLVVIAHSFARKEFVFDLMGQELEISQGTRIAIGVGLVLLGVAFPGLVNWFVASARDANLFS